MSKQDLLWYCRRCGYVIKRETSHDPSDLPECLNCYREGNFDVFDWEPTTVEAYEKMVVSTTEAHAQTVLEYFRNREQRGLDAYWPDGRKKS